MDGSVGLGQDPVPPGGKFIYEFTLHQAGTFFYHSHFAMQEMMGMLGLFIMHPKEPIRAACAIAISESFCRSGRCCQIIPSQYAVDGVQLAHV